MAGQVTIAEVEHFFEAGKQVEKRTTRGERSLTGAHSGEGTGG